MENMGRLTKRELIKLKNGEEIVACNYKDEDCNDYCMHGYCRWNDKALKKLKEYEDLEEQGMLLRLPCKVGDIVYNLTFSERRRSGYRKDKIAKIIIENNEVILFFKTGLGKKIDTFNSTMFLTKESAEAALKEMEK